MRRCLRSLFLAGPVLLAAATAAFAAADAVPPDRLSGYTLTFSIRWNGIPAATAVATLHSDAPEAADARHYIEINTQTLPLLRLIWPARSLVKAAVGRDLSSRSFSIYRRERRKEQSVEITFDPVAGQVYAIRRKPSGSVKEVTRALEDLQEPLSLLYTLRNRPTELGNSYNANIVVNDDLYRVTVTVVDHGRIRLAGRRVPVVCVSPSAIKTDEDGEEPLGKVGAVRIWVTDDALRLPVRLQARAFVGRISATLRRMSPPLREVYAALDAESARVAGAATGPAPPAGE